MASWVEFEEKEYEFQASHELARGGGFVWAPGQVLEAILSCDALAAPVARHVVWQLLRVPRPKGVVVAPAHWGSAANVLDGRLPQHPFSIIVQYKRPEYLRGARAAQWKYWHRPYYRFTCSPKQHSNLRQLERRLLGSAIVRYASPSLRTTGELEAAALNQEVLTQTGFVSPGRLGRHLVWTYVEPGLAGRANPSGQRIWYESLSEMLQEAFRQLARSEILQYESEPIDALYDHISVLAEVCRDRRPSLRKAVDDWVELVRARDLLLTNLSLQLVGDLASISSLFHSLDATWLILDAADL